MMASLYSMFNIQILILIFSVSILLLFGISPCNGQTLFVSPTGDGTTGLSWATAFNKVSDAASAATSGDQIWIASGTYHESVTLKPSLSLYGGFAGTETDSTQRNLSVNTTTIDGSAAHTSVILGATGTILDGLRITGGNVDGLGGGLYCENASMTLRRCSVAGNTVYSSRQIAAGGGIYGISSDLTLQDCDIYQNRTLLANPPMFYSVRSGYGGGIALFGGSLFLDRCTIRENIAGVTELTTGSFILNSSGGGVYVTGHLSCNTCSFEVNHVGQSISGDLSTARGGAVVCDGDAIFNKCVIRDNSASVNLTYADFSVQGGGLFISGIVSFRNILLYRNSLQAYSINGGARQFGGVSLWCEGDSDLENCTIFTHWHPEISGVGPAGIQGISGVVSIQNSITGSMNYGYEIQSADVRYSDILGGFPGEGNINLDPQFVDPAKGDFRLLASSPCIDAGTTTGPASDILGHPRPVDVPGVGREGAVAFDMGAYEFQLSDLPTPTPTATVTRTPTITTTPTATDSSTPVPTPTSTANASSVRDWTRYP